jgi:hypothetical protein
VKLLFVKSSKPASKLIQWGLKSDCSHFAVCFDEQANGSGIVFHSVLGGATLEWFGLFKKQYDVVHALEFKTRLTLADEEDIYQGMLSQYSGQSYDYFAFMYWFYVALKWRVFGKPIPLKNSWAKAGFNLCTGLAAGVKWINQWAQENNIDLEMIAPHDLHEKLLATGYFCEAKDIAK